MQQEDFAGRLTATMEQFFGLHYGGSWRAVWNDPAPRAGSQRWLINTHINSVFFPGIRMEALEVVRREFGTSVVRWKRPLQRAYFLLATARTASRLASATITVNPAVPDADRWLIVPGTHKVRFIHSESRICYCCRKAGADFTHFRQELALRRYAEMQGAPVPPILYSLSDDCVAEQMIHATPLNRLNSPAARDAGLKIAVRSLEPVYRASSRWVSVADYSAGIVSRIESAAASSPEMASSQPGPMAELLYQMLNLPRDVVELVRSHGDFQPGNILYSDGRVWLIDWEYSQDRSRDFDRLTYELRARFAIGLADRIRRCAQACATASQRLTLRLFLLETILFECDAARVASHAVPRSFHARLAEIAKSIPSLLTRGDRAAEWLRDYAKTCVAAGR